MLPLKISEFVHALSEKEDTRFRLFLDSPYYNKRKDLILLYNALRALRPDFLKKQDRKALFQQVYPGEAYSDQRFRTVCSLLNKQLEHFLVTESNDSSEMLNQINLFRVFREKNLLRHYQIQEKKLNSQLADFPFQNHEYFSMVLEFQLEQYRFHESQRRTELLGLDKISETLDQLFLIQRFRLSTLVQAYLNVYKGSEASPLLEPGLSYYKKNETLNSPSTSIYYYSYQCLRYPEEVQYFNLLKDHILRYGDLLPQRERREVYLAAINYCIRKLNSGDQSFAKKGLELFQAALDHNALSDERGYLSRFSYRNGFAMAMTLKQYTWAETFLENYREALNPEYRESIYSFNLAKLRYEQGRLSESIGLLQQAEYDDLLLNLASKSLLSKIYYEAEEYDALDSLLDSFKVFILRKKPLGYHKENYQNFIRLTKKLLQLNIYDQQSSRKLLDEVLKTPILTEKQWFVDNLGDTDMVNVKNN